MVKKVKADPYLVVQSYEQITRLAYHIDQDDNNLWLANADGGPLKKLTQMPHLQHEPAWSPDSGKLYFLSGQGDQSHDLWQLNLTDGRTTQLTVGQLYHFDVAVGPDGTLAYSSNRSGHYDIWLWPPNSEPRPLTDHAALDARPSWSPDGQSLLFESTRNGVPNIWRIAITGDQPEQLTHHAQGARQPVWWGGDTP